MANYLAQRIIDGAFTYEQVVQKYPQYSENINAYLAQKNRTDLIPSPSE